MSNKTLELEFKRGRLPIEELENGVRIIKPIYGPLKRVEKIETVTDFKKIVITTENVDNDVQWIRHYFLKQGKLKLFNQRFYNRTTGKFYN